MIDGQAVHEKEPLVPSLGALSIYIPNDRFLLVLQYSYKPVIPCKGCHAGEEVCGYSA